MHFELDDSELLEAQQVSAVRRNAKRRLVQTAACATMLTRLPPTII